MNPQIDKIRDFIEKNNKGQKWIVDNLIFLTRTGSKLYGTDHALSDDDFVGVTVPPPEHWILEPFDQFKMEETTIYGIQKFLKLILLAGPNMVEMLFINKDNPNVIVWEPLWQQIIDNRDMLLSQKIFHTFSGYSASQKHKVMNDQAQKPSRQGIINEYGFDLKFALHAIRIMRQGVELIRDGKIEFPRKDAQELLDIRFGRRYKSMEEFLKEWESLDEEIKGEVKKSPLQWGPNHKFVNQLLMKIFEKDVWNKALAQREMNMIASLKSLPCYELVENIEI